MVILAGATCLLLGKVLVERVEARRRRGIRPVGDDVADGVPAVKHIHHVGGNDNGGDVVDHGGVEEGVGVGDDARILAAESPTVPTVPTVDVPERPPADLHQTAF